MRKKFEPGNSYAQNGLGGRPKGSRNKLTQKVIEDVWAHWRDHGIEALHTTYIEKPAEYVRAVLSILPKEFVFENVMADLDDNQIDEVLERIRDQMLLARETDAVH